MIAALSGFFDWPQTPIESTAPERNPAPEPVFISDILSARWGEPELLIQWRKEERTIDP